MSDLELTSVRLPSKTLDAVRELVSESKRREDVPEMSQSSVLREMFMAGLEENDDLLDLVDEPTRILMMRQRFMDKEGKVVNLRTGFRSKVNDLFEKRFESGFDAEELAGFRENMIRDAHLLWPEWSDHDYREEREKAIQYVDEVCLAAQDAAETSDFDPLDPEHFGRFSGVEAGRERQVVEENAVEIATEITRRINKLGGRLDPDALVTSIAKQYDVEEDRVWELVDAIRGEGSSDLALDEKDLPALGVVSDD